MKRKEWSVTEKRVENAAVSLAGKQRTRPISRLDWNVAAKVQGNAEPGKNYDTNTLRNWWQIVKKLFWLYGRNLTSTKHGDMRLMKGICLKEYKPSLRKWEQLNKKNDVLGRLFLYVKKLNMAGNNTCNVHIACLVFILFSYGKESSINRIVVYGTLTESESLTYE